MIREITSSGIIFFYKFPSNFQVKKRMFVFFKQKKNKVLLYVIIEVLNFFKKCNILYVWSAEQNMLYRYQDPLADPEGSMGVATPDLKY